MKKQRNNITDKLKEKYIPQTLLSAKQMELVNQVRNAINNDPSQFLDWEDVQDILNVPN